MRGAEDDGGFSLIELLVVMIIIGILAAIAVPIFLHQRQSARDAEAKSDLRNLAHLEEQHLQASDVYGTIADINASGDRVVASKGVTLTVVTFDTDKGFCLAAKHTDSSNTWYYDSRSFGLQPHGAAGCPVSTTGAAGDSITG